VSSFSFDLKPPSLVEARGGSTDSGCLYINCIFIFFHVKENRSKRKRPCPAFSCASPNRPMPQASCCQARRRAKRGAQQSSDCEHPSELGNAAWRREAPRHRPIEAAGARGNAPACAKATAGLRQFARFNPFAAPMLGAGQREIQTLNLKNRFSSPLEGAS